jgi:U3 small nucleolar RNA-associated protein 11
MARFKLDVQKRQHRERSQPLQRQRLGLLEKHADYVKRAKDYNSKKDRLQKLRLKASLKNQDEFYFKMLSSKTVKDVHYTFNKSNPPLDNQLVKLLKTQDFNYVKTCRAIEEKVSPIASSPTTPEHTPLIRIGFYFSENRQAEGTVRAHDYPGAI